MKRPRLFIRRTALVAAAFYYAGLLAAMMTTLGMVDPAPAQARVDPLLIISRQIHKPNMLIVLDTSGSLTGVPGGSFTLTYNRSTNVISGPTEVGVDCDDGNNCRGGDASGTCAISGKFCSSDIDCRSYTCKVDASSCITNADCAPQAGKCTQSTCDSNNSNCVNAACFIDADCPASTTGKCATSGSVCTPKTKCSSALKCTYGTSTCSSTSTPCASYALCQDSAGKPTSQQCAVASDCPFQTIGGTCAIGSKACTKVSDCGKVCPDHATACLTDLECGQCSKGSTSSGSPYCKLATDCAKSGAGCTITANSCSTANNVCNFPHYACTVSQSSNACIDTNKCVGPANTCTAGPTNPCLSGSIGDVCKIVAAAGTTGMCRTALTICAKDSDCPTGDACGPATSRVVIAKRVLAEMVNDNAQLVNFGLMTFYQKNYFPYYALSGASTSTQTTFIDSVRLDQKNCFTTSSGPSSTCVIDGVTYTLRTSANSRYRVGGTGGTNSDVNWCGSFCPISGQGTGSYNGSYYTYAVQNGTKASSATVKTTYVGKSTSVSGTAYRYYDSIPNFYNPAATSTMPPIAVADCSLNVCNATCGARWDDQLAPFLDTSDDPNKADAMAAAINDRMQPASYGGIVAYGGTPTGCSLENNLAPNKNASAYDYMKAVQAADKLTCRQDYILLITDGEANGPGDDKCDASACAADDPRAAGCTCRSVLAAQDLKKIGVKTFVVGFSGDVAIGTGKATNDNIAKAGGTDRGGDGKGPYAYSATSEAELVTAVQSAIYDAVKGSYSTSPPAVSSGNQLANSVTTGGYALDSRVDFPSWKGHLLAYDATASGTGLVWDAAVQLANQDWKTRRVYTSDTSGGLVKVAVDASTGAIANKATLQGLGLGATTAEAEVIARWMLGDPALGNPAVLGAIVNSTPIDVGQPGSDPNPGGKEFSDKYANRPQITYVGADDGMLHAFYTRDVTIGGVAHTGGSEAFAYIPPEMLSTITKLYAQGGQLPDPSKHIYGLASSAKVKSICTSNCTDKTSAVWKTVLVMTDGYGGNEAFALDVTDPTASTPFSLMWHTLSVASKTSYDSLLGQTISVPGFVFNYTPNYDDNRLVFTSGYPVTSGSTTQGRSFIAASAASGEILTKGTVTPAGACGSTPEFTMLTDVPTARDNGKDAKRTMLAAYAGDTWGSLWRFTLGAAPAAVMGPGCTQPLHYAPAVVQLDRDDFTAHPHEVYLVQVTNSALDNATKDFAASQLVFKRDIVTSGTVVGDTTFGSSGALTLTVGVDKAMCAITDSSGACTTTLPVAARPMGTPIAILKSDASGFVVISTWYVPDPVGCGKGTTYLQVHQLTAVTGGSATVTLKQAIKIADEPVSSPIVVGGKIVILSSNGPITLNSSMTQSYVVGQATPNNGANGEPFRMLGWFESL
jgi:Neisseria PilC beta-propeller domain